MQTLWADLNELQKRAQTHGDPRTWWRKLPKWKIINRGPFWPRKNHAPPEIKFVDAKTGSEPELEGK